MKPWTFIVAADMQPGSPKSYRYRPAWIENWRTAKKQIVEIGPDLLLIPGDLTRDGSIHRFELEEMKDDLDSLPFPYHVVPGNMDTGNKHTHQNAPRASDSIRMDDIDLNVTSEQLQQFASVFGPLHWSFVHKNVRFSGFPDVAIGSGLPEENAFWEWAEKLKRQPHISFDFTSKLKSKQNEEHHVWIMHQTLFVDDLHEPNWDITKPEEHTAWYFSIDEPHRSKLMDLFKATGTDIVITGHIHCRKVNHAGGIRFDLAPSVAFSQWANRWPDGDPTLGFLRYDVSDSGIECKFISLEKVSKDNRGYGPGGHPKPEYRDYSIAWEK